VKLEEYRKRLIELESLPWNESYRKIAELQAEYLSGQVVPDAETAIKFISDAQQRGELPSLDVSVRLESCELIDPYDEKSPDKRWWRCWFNEVVLDVSAESGEVGIISYL
jgi:hypothetical protein